ncbi:MAG: TonB-dependent receptor plug domain-containing protein [Nibricoccus sp.]
MNSLTRMSLAALLCASLGHAQTAGPAPESKEAEKKQQNIPVENADNELVVLSPFEVATIKDTGYEATETLAGTRIRTKLRDVGSSLSVVTKGFLQDVGATNSATLLQYTTNTEVSGTLGSYTGLGNGWSPNEQSTLRGAGYSQRVRGLAAAQNTRDFFTTDIPWDSFNVDRIDLQRGPNSILFGLGSPAGNINASINNAQFSTKGQAELRVGSYGSTRGSVDYNQVLIDNLLSIRVAGLKDDKKFQQQPAYENDHRMSLALRFDPKLINEKGFNTSLKFKYEAGEIKANRPRVLPPYDQITPWFRSVEQDASGLYTANSGLGKIGVNYPTEVVSTSNPWIGQTAANQQQPIWFIDGNNSELYRIFGGFVNRGARTTAGVAQGASASLNNQKYGDIFPGIRSYSSYAGQAQLPGWQNGQYRDVSLTDSSIFDFYNNLIDGDSKKEFAHWYAYNFDFTQTGWDDRVGVQLSYDRQWYKNGGQSLLGNPALSVDILRNLQDRPDVTASQAATNPNYGRPYIVAGPGSGSSYNSNREAYRASVFGELRSDDFFEKGSLLAKLFGRHRFNGVYASETLDTENLGWNIYAHSRDWAGYWNQNDGSNVSITERPPVAVIYLGSATAVAASPNGSNINVPNITSNVALTSGNVYHFNSTWNAPASVGYGDPWTVPASLTNLISTSTPTYQASNPANYVGWNSNFYDSLITNEDGQNKTLLTSASLAERKLRSYAGSWQGFMWNEAIVPTLGWRFDEVKSLSVSARPVSTNRNILNTDGSVYRLPNFYAPGQVYKAHSTAGGLVVHLNQLVPKDPLPFNISVSYNKSNSFEITNARRDFYGNAISNPNGDTKEYGVLLSTKDGKYSLRVQKYETRGRNVGMDTSLDGLANALTQGIKFRNVLLYRLSAYDWSGREQATNGHGNRYNWYAGYVDNTTGKVVSDYDETNPSATPQPSNTYLETATQAANRRDASIRAWNAIQQKMTDLGFFGAWQYSPTTLSALTDRATLEATATGTDSSGKLIYASQYTPATTSLANYSRIAPSGLTLTSDTLSKGYEMEFTANPTASLRLSLNAAKTTAIRKNVGSAALDETVAYMDQQMAGAAGDMRQFNGAYVRGNELRFTYSQWRGQYALAKLQDGAEVPELRKWRFNAVANYSFRTGMLKGAFVGGGYRWQDKNIIGYPMKATPGSDYGTYDLSKPYHGPSEDAIDLWVGYTRKVSRNVEWKIQLNVRNVGDKEGLIPITVQPDGVTPAAYRIKPVQEWAVTNTFTF